MEAYAPRHILSLVFGFISLVMLSILAITSVDLAVKKMGFKNWKLLHRLIYIAGLLLLLHILLVGTHFSDLTGLIPEITFLAVAFLLFLNARRFDAFLKQKWGIDLQFGLVTALLLGVLVLVSIVVLNPFSRGKDGGISLGIHSAHIKLAQEAQSGNSQLTGTIPGLDGDKNIRYTVSLDTPDQINPNEDTTLSFRVFNARTGNPVGAFKEVYTKTSHLIIVNSALDYFSHIHPEQKDNGFVVTTQFPSSGVYHLYIDFQPYGGIEQQIGFSVTVCCGESAKPTQKPDTTLTKEFGSHLVTLNMHGALSAAKMTLGQQKISFTLSDAKTK